MQPGMIYETVLKTCLILRTLALCSLYKVRSEEKNNAEIVYPLAHQAPELRGPSETPKGKYRFDDKKRVIAAISCNR